MMNILSLQELKRTVINTLRQMFNYEPDIIIQERGKDACVLVDIKHYNYLRECELEVALIKAREEIVKNKFTVGIQNHIEKIQESLQQK